MAEKLQTRRTSFGTHAHPYGAGENSLVQTQGVSLNKTLLLIGIISQGTLATTSHRQGFTSRLSSRTRRNPPTGTHHRLPIHLPLCAIG
ncbi:hypothetical protein KC19_VG200100 [Ceratodon purpureus]|uniref:Uncharacterized protein n=1 Tax=Ceratodon purpureus TaxID=3225 RepID=A0A8T0HSD9_CERPU|nr:hypothetical protein KC19_VG200100 [Ceratodon purpureus]